MELSSSIIDSIIGNLGGDDAIAFHYCDYKSKESQDLENIICSLIAQTAQQSDSAFDKLKEIYDKYDPNGSRSTRLRDCNIDLVKVLHQLSKSYSTVSIVIDGLDECSGERGELINQLDRLPDIGGRIKILLASRLEQEFESLLSNYRQIEIIASTADVQLYVTSVIDTRIRLGKLKLKDPALKDLISTKLVEGSKGMFQWVVCQVDHLCHLGNDKARRTALENLPPGLNDIYQNILRRIISKEGDYGGSDYSQAREYLLRTLVWLSFSEYPLTLPELTEAIADIATPNGYYDPDSIVDEEDILFWGSSLIRHNRQTNCLEFSHFTVKDFLVDGRTTLHSPMERFKLDYTTSQLWMAKFCLRFLMLKDFDTKDILERGLMDSDNTYPFLKYAERFWDTHARLALPDWDEEIRSLVQTFLAPKDNPYFQRWRKRNAVETDNKSPSMRPKILGPHFFAQDDINLHFAAGAGLLDATKSLAQDPSLVNFLNIACGTPLSAALWKFYGAHASGLAKASKQRILNDYNQIITTLLDLGADPNLYLPDQPQTDPYFAFFQAPEYDERVAQLLFPRFQRQVSIELVDAICCRLYEKWISGPQTIKLITSSPGCWTQDNKIQVCKAIVGSGALRKEDSYLLESLEVLDYLDHDQSANDSRFPDIEKFRLQHTDTFKQEIMARYHGALIVAAESGMGTVVENLISKYPWIVDLPDSEGFTPLGVACHKGHEHIVTKLLAHGACANTLSICGTTALHIACASGELECFNLLLAAGADVNKPAQPDIDNMYFSYLKEDILNVKGDTPLVFACRSGYERIVNVLLDHGVDVNRPGWKGRTPLHAACKNGRLECVRLLLAIGADVNAQNDEGRTPLMCLWKNRHDGPPENWQDISDTLFSSNIDFSLQTTQNETYLHFAASLSHPKYLELLLQKSIDIDAQRADGATALHIAAENPNPNLVRLLLLHNASVNLVDCYKLNSLMYACRSGSPQTIIWLVEAGVDITAESSFNLRAYQYACLSNDPNNLVSLLNAVMSSGGEVSMADGHMYGLTGTNILHIAVENQSPEVALELVKYLIKLPEISVDYGDELDNTALKLACIMLKRESQYRNKTDMELHYPESGCYLRLQVVKALLTRTSSPSGFEIGEKSTLAVALQVRCESCWREVLEAFVKCQKDIIETIVTTNGRTPLLFCFSPRSRLCWSWNLNGPCYERATTLIDLGANVSATLNDGSTALHMVCESTDDNCYIARLLIENGADPEAKSSLGVTPLMLASTQGNIDIVRMLVHHGVDVLARDNNGYSALHLAASWCPDKLVASVLKCLLGAGADINVPATRKSEEGNTPLMSAILAGKLLAVSYILRQEATDISAINTLRHGIWHMAIRSVDRNAAVQILGEKNITANINLADRLYNVTPLLWALAVGAVEPVIRSIIKLGGDIFARDSAGLSSLEYATLSGKPNIVRLMLENTARLSFSSKHKFNFNFFDNHLPPQSTRTELIKQLLQHHDSLDSKDILGFCGWGQFEDEIYHLVASFVFDGKVVYVDDGMNLDTLYRKICLLSGRHGDFRLQRIFQERMIHTGLSTGVKASPVEMVSAAGVSGPGICLEDLKLVPRRKSDSELTKQPPEYPNSTSPGHPDPYSNFEVKGTPEWFEDMAMSIVQGKWIYEKDKTLSTGSFARTKNISFTLPSLLRPTVLQFKSDMTILQVAIHTQDFEAVRVLLLHGCLLGVENSQGNNGLLLILCKDDWILLESIAKLIETSQLKLRQNVHPRGDTRGKPGTYWIPYLHFLAQNGGWRCVKPLVRIAPVLFDISIPDFCLVDVKNRGGWTLLRTAVEKGNLKFIEEIFKLPITPIKNTWEFEGAYSLKRRAIELGHFGIAEALISHDPNGDITSQNRFNQHFWPFWAAKDRASLEAILQAGCDIGFWDEFQGHPIHFLLKMGGHISLGVFLRYLGTDKALAQLLRRTTLFGHALEIVGDLGCISCIQALQDFFGLGLAGFPDECIEEGSVAALKQGYVELSEIFKKIVQRRKGED
ncbi:hypothetical protein TWF730_010482 [Orbilia blumenaviensis]|uniref:Nephrocystin 3-like N-terminal domain-containing protein n=1 Tax=Orbilia blumenaviensis TaxID=1796055 RepID=A0AAV9URU0_9PEZI